jgi:hypothetical protein
MSPNNMSDEKYYTEKLRRLEELLINKVAQSSAKLQKDTSSDEETPTEDVQKWNEEMELRVSKLMVEQDLLADIHECFEDCEMAKRDRDCYTKKIFENVANNKPIFDDFDGASMFEPQKLPEWVHLLTGKVRIFLKM